jgi:hypothetical protein
MLINLIVILIVILILLIIVRTRQHLNPSIET